MHIWLPYIEAGTGSDTFTHTLANGLRKQGHTAIEQPLPHFYQYVPWLLKKISPPPNTEIILANTWNAFAFARSDCQLVAVQHLFVLDPALAPYKSFAQSVFHNTFIKYFETQTTRTANSLVSVSLSTAKAMSKGLGIPLPKVILNGINTDFFSPTNKPKNNNSPMRLLFVGNMTHRKGADLIPAIMKKLGTEFELYYTSGLRAKDPFKNIPNMHSLGKLNKKEVRDEYRKADLLLFPTRLEGFGLVAAEAMACGTPVIASNNSALPEVIKHDVTGYLCPTDDISAFVATIRDLKNNKKKLTRISNAALTMTKKEFSIDRMTSEYEELFKFLLEKKHEEKKK